MILILFVPYLYVSELYMYTYIYIYFKKIDGEGERTKVNNMPVPASQ